MDEREAINAAVRAAHQAIAEVVSKAEEAGIEDENGDGVSGKVVLMISSATLVCLYATLSGLPKDRLLEGVALTYDEMKDATDKASAILQAILTEDNGGSEWLQ